MAELSPAPTWFTTALETAPEEGRVDVDGASVAYLAWGAPNDPTLVLVHGGAAHARWWSPLAPLLAQNHRVVALDLSGHGDSEHRDEYRVEQWCEEVLAVAGAAGSGDPPVIVGHSMGGFVTVVTAARHGAELEGAIVMDTSVRRPDPESREGTEGRMFRQPKTYPDLETAVEHFHLVPPQPTRHPWMIDHVARTSLRQTPAGWTWKFDPKLFSNRRGPAAPTDYGPALGSAACRIAVINGARSAIVDDDVRAYMAELVADSPAAVAGVPFIEVPEAHHHLFLDQPLAVVTALRAVLAVWHPVGAPPPRVDGR